MKEEKEKTKKYLEKKKWNIVSESLDDDGYNFTFLVGEVKVKLRIEVEKVIINDVAYEFKSHNVTSYHRKISTVLTQKKVVVKEKKEVAKKTTKKQTSSEPIVVSADLIVSNDSIISLIDMVKGKFIDISLLLTKTNL